jgi:HPt (histidine-containing phosphotransfer) domain-containing protein
MTMVEMDANQERALLAPLWAKNRHHVLERLAHVRAVLATPEGCADTAVRDDLHALVGTLGTYGFPQGSALARTILQALVRDGCRDREALLRRLDELIVALSEV